MSGSESTNMGGLIALVKRCPTAFLHLLHLICRSSPDRIISPFGRVSLTILLVITPRTRRRAATISTTSTLRLRCARQIQRRTSPLLVSISIFAGIQKNQADLRKGMATTTRLRYNTFSSNNPDPGATPTLPSSFQRDT